MKKQALIILFLCLLSCNNRVKTKNVEANYNNSNKILVEDTNLLSSKKIEYPIKYFKVKADSITGNEVYNISDISFKVKIKEKKEEGLYFEASKKDELLYKSEGQYDSWRFNLTFLNNKTNSNLIVLGEIGDEESWGLYIYLYDGFGFKKLGFLDIVALNEYKESMNIMPYINILEVKHNEFNIKFNGNIKIYDNALEKTFTSQSISFSYLDNKLKKKIK